MTEPHLPIRGDGGNGRARGIPTELFDPPRVRDRRRWVDARSIITALVGIIAAAIVTGVISFIGSTNGASAQVRETADRVSELRVNIVELQRKQVQADIDAARLAGNYEAVVKAVDQRLQMMQNQLDRIERQR